MSIIEERIGHWFATILLWAVSVAVFLGALYYTITLTQKLSKIIMEAYRKVRGHYRAKTTPKEVA